MKTKEDGSLKSAGAIGKQGFGAHTYCFVRPIGTTYCCTFDLKAIEEKAEEDKEKATGPGSSRPKSPSPKTSTRNTSSRIRKGGRVMHNGRPQGGGTNSPEMRSSGRYNGHIISTGSSHDSVSFPQDSDWSGNRSGGMAYEPPACDIKMEIRKDWLDPCWS